MRQATLHAFVSGLISVPGFRKPLRQLGVIELGQIGTEIQDEGHLSPLLRELEA
jgi:hypothetical protein